MSLEISSQFLSNPFLYSSILSIFLLIFFGIKYFKNKKLVDNLTTKLERYSSIENIEEERKRIEKEIKEKINSSEENLKSLQKQKNTLSKEYKEGIKTYEKLTKEISYLKDDLEMLDYGLYKPSFTFADSEKCKDKLSNIHENIKYMIKTGSAIYCPTEWKVGDSKREGQKMVNRAKKLALRAFNGECDSALAKVSWNNYDKMVSRIRSSYEKINELNEVLHISISEYFLQIREEQLRIKYEYDELRQRELDDLRARREEERDSERAQREIEKAKLEAQKEEDRARKSLDKAKKELENAHGEKINKLNEQIKKLESDLLAAQELGKRALSRAQITKSGFVYILSNIGAFGKDIYKIGLTRRLEPEDRVKELSGASVPFEFDIHALIYDDDAPGLETKLHKLFANKKVNLVNNRKEFFNITLDEIEEWIVKNKPDSKFIKTVEARTYRETLAIREKGKEAIEKQVKELDFAPNLFDEEDEENNGK